MFVVSDDARDWGTGKTVSRTSKLTKVQRFDHPKPHSTIVRKLPLQGLRQRKLESQTLVFFRMPKSAWRQGRVVEVQGDRVEVHVRPFQ
jgi:hypothetical protein